jgi:hypothetical protein
MNNREDIKGREETLQQNLFLMRQLGIKREKLKTRLALVVYQRQAATAGILFSSVHLPS